MPLIICPECKKEVSSEALACIHCGYPIAKNHFQSQGEPVNSTDVTYIPATAGDRFSFLFMSFVLGIGGLFLFIIPIIGWILGILCTLGAFVALVKFFSTSDDIGKYKGICPYCNLAIEIEGKNSESNSCIHCKNRVIIKKNCFYTIAASRMDKTKTKKALDPNKVTTQENDIDDFCYHCGAANPKRLKYCPECGKKL